MDVKYKNVKRLGWKKWLLGGNSKIYGIILLVTLAAIILVLSVTKGMGEINSDEETTEVAKETSLQESATASNAVEIIPPHEQYKIMVNKAKNFITIYTMDEEKNYTVVHKQFRCSVNPSVSVQTTSISYKYTWVVFGRNLCGRYASKLSNGTYIHSTPYYNQDVYMVNKKAYNNLGNSAELGYIYLSVVDSKWIFENCGMDTVVEVYEDANETSPFAGVKLEPATMPYDPTDTEAAANYVPETKAPETQAVKESEAASKETPSETTSDEALENESPENVTQASSEAGTQSSSNMSETLQPVTE